MKLCDINLSPQQEDIVINTAGNIVVSASAGTGKTHTMIAKICHDLLENKTHKMIASITFTIRAAQEIRDRLTLDTTQCFIGTNNSFAIEEIIKPFLKDVYGDEYDVDLDTDYANRDNRLNSLADGLESIKITHTIYSYADNRRNFVFDLALDIIKKSEACRLYLQAKYFGIYIDEYQDCDIDMHKFFMYLCDELRITTFIVGDEKQSIYRWRGANPASFISVFTKAGFTHKFLTENHRSDKQIQDYSNLLFAATRELVTQPQNTGDIIWLAATNEDWASKVIPLLDASKTSALLRSQKEYSGWTQKYGASEGATLLSQSGIEHIYIPPTPIDDITTNAAWLYTAIASYILLSSYSAYDFINDIPTENDKVSVGRTQQMLRAIEQHVDEQAIFAQKVNTLADYLGYPTMPQHIESLFETIVDPKYAVALNPEKPKHCTLTLHSSKGLEFDQVVIFIEDYAHNGAINDEHINNHYVACTRAKSKLIIVNTETNDANAVRHKIISLFQDANIPCGDLITVQ
ncbi:UvrD-helicase domain-containing protein [Caproicibacter sp. BJN0012]|uniref:UvrD-helicase domain-containing protein n=1 Tax=Caproicibacter sp. BJN0012 TaxID=3110227 RepID=UPI002B216A3B|nr:MULTISPECIES: UvrD-helicase domain-containing protein [Eubacteriales]MEA4992715.1 UvrD-helicase domain-containing protein [Oscillibacter sp.]